MSTPFRVGPQWPASNNSEVKVEIISVSVPLYRSF